MKNAPSPLIFEKPRLRGAAADMYFDDSGELDEQEYRFTHKSSAVPGSVAGFDHILRRYGTMSWQQVAEPALRLAEDGFRVTDDLAINLKRSKERLTQNPTTRATYYKADGSELRGR